jgi:hypothetical protein
MVGLSSQSELSLIEAYLCLKERKILSGIPLVVCLRGAQDHSLLCNRRITKLSHPPTLGT